jgi:hypothetical protein
MCKDLRERLVDRGGMPHHIAGQNSTISTPTTMAHVFMAVFARTCLTGSKLIFAPASRAGKAPKTSAVFYDSLLTYSANFMTLEIAKPSSPATQFP